LKTRPIGKALTRGSGSATAAAAGLVPWFIALTLAAPVGAVLAGRWPLTALLA